MRSALILLAAPLLVWPATAQESASFKISEHAFNSGGHPSAGTIPGSTSYRITLDALGEGVVGPTLSSESFVVEPGFGSCYPPPGEVLGLGFSDAETIHWAPERSVGTYQRYRGLLSSLSELSYGACVQHGLSGTSAVDPELPPGQDGYFYLVTAVNRLDEEGTKGVHSDASERQGAVCP